MTVSTLDIAIMAFIGGVAVTVFAGISWWFIRAEFRSYTDGEVREAKRDIKQWVRERDR